MITLLTKGPFFKYNALDEAKLIVSSYGGGGGVGDEAADRGMLIP